MLGSTFTPQTMASALKIMATKSTNPDEAESLYEGDAGKETGSR